MSAGARTQAAIGRLFAAVESRDVFALEDLLAEDVAWQNVPEPAVRGRAGVAAMFERILPLCSHVEWEVTSGHHAGDTAWIEHVDHFTIDGTRHSVHCNGVFTVDPASGTLRSVRDYGDLTDWRQRIGAVYARRAAEPAVVVVARHLDAVGSGDVVAMAADYALDAVLERPGMVLDGRRAIARYFADVPARLGDRRLTLGEPVGRDGQAVVDWHLDDSVGREVARGTDRFEVVAGRITRQVVTLSTADF